MKQLFVFFIILLNIFYLYFSLIIDLIHRINYENFMNCIFMSVGCSNTMIWSYNDLHIIM